MVLDPSTALKSPKFTGEGSPDVVCVQDNLRNLEYEDGVDQNFDLDWVSIEGSKVCD